MRLYHHTSVGHLPWILGFGEIYTTESNIGALPELQDRVPNVAPIGEHVGPDVVWFTSNPSPAGCGLEGSQGKGLIRIQVELPDQELHHWQEWAHDQGIDKRWYDLLAQGRRDAEWWVVERNVPHQEWIDIVGRAATSGRNDPCPCSSGKKRKFCHVDRDPIWVLGLPIEVKYTEEEVRAHVVTLVEEANGVMIGLNAEGQRVTIEVDP